MSGCPVCSPGIRRHGYAIASLLVLCFTMAICGADDIPAPDRNAELASLLAAARQYKIRLAGSDAALTLRDPAVLNFTNPERNQECGSVYVWMQGNRPAVIGQFFRYGTSERRKTKHALHSLWHKPVEARYDDALAWAPQQAGLQWKAFSDAPAPASGHVNRLLQMRQLARRFKLTLTSPTDVVTELRMIPRPLFEYSAPESGITDGIIVSYVIATDPEAILLIEAFDEQGTAGFRYAFARFHFWKIIALDAETKVWEATHDPELKMNPFGNPETLDRIYTSFYPREE